MSKSKKGKVKKSIACKSFFEYDLFDKLLGNPKPIKRGRGRPKKESFDDNYFTDNINF